MQMSDMTEGQAAQEPQDPRPVLWTVGCAHDKRADMLWENKPCRDAEQVLAVVKDAIERGATEIKVRDFAFTFSRKYPLSDETDAKVERILAMTDAECLAAGIFEYGSEEAWRKAMASSKKNMLAQANAQILRRALADAAHRFGIALACGTDWIKGTNHVGMVSMRVGLAEATAALDLAAPIGSQPSANPPA